MIFKVGAAEEAAAETSASVDFVSTALDGVTCTDFESCRLAAQRLSELHFNVSHAMAHTYDPNNASGFKDLVSFFSSLFSDKQEAAVVFGVSVSTFYRWKSGDTIPHALVRSTIKATILRHLEDGLGAAN